MLGGTAPETGFWYLAYHTLFILDWDLRPRGGHAAQLNLLLRQNVNDAPRWVRKAD